MAEKRSAIRNFFSFRTSYFNTNLKSEPLVELDIDSVDNNGRKRRQNQNRNNNGDNQNNGNNNRNNNRNNRNNNGNNNNNQDQQTEKTGNNNNNNNSSSTVVQVTTEVTQEEQDQNEEQIENSDIISDLLGHFGWWQFIWTLTLSLFQFPSTFHLFSFVFEVSRTQEVQE